MCLWAGGMGWRLFALTMPPQAIISLSLRPTILILLSSAHQTQSRCSLVLPDSWPHQHPCSVLFFILTVPVIRADAFWFPGIPVSRTGLLQCLSILELSSATDSVIVSQAYYQQPQPSWDFSDIHCSLMTSSSLSRPGLINPTVLYYLPLPVLSSSHLKFKSILLGILSQTRSNVYILHETKLSVHKHLPQSDEYV